MCLVPVRARFWQLVDVGRQLMTNRLSGYLNGRILFFLQNLNIAPRPIWITRHGESEYNVKVCDAHSLQPFVVVDVSYVCVLCSQGLIGGDSGLSPRGISYAQKLAAFMNKARQVPWPLCHTFSP